MNELPLAGNPCYLQRTLRSLPGGGNGGGGGNIASRWKEMYNVVSTLKFKKNLFWEKIDAFKFSPLRYRKWIWEMLIHGKRQFSLNNHGLYEASLTYVTYICEIYIE